MKIHHILLFCFLSALCGGNTMCVSAEIKTFRGAEGQGITVVCRFSFSGNRKSFCKEECEGANVLIVTSEAKAHNNKYSIDYQEAFMSSGTLFVTITQLTKSDSGRYRCRLETLFLNLYDDVELVVEDAANTSSIHSTPTTFHLLPNELVAKGSGYFLPLVTCLPVVVLLLALVLLLLYKLRSKRNIDGLNSGGNLDDRNTKISPYEVYVPPPPCQESTYQNLNSASIDPNQIYCTITHSHPG
ncbi:Polymeric immunoglobulin receptor [Channa argus]|uniref:uncharacterized protein isoform X1 n=2 Tax=Channa argus TaxID=215402 RepID=UPI0014173E19|nr:Polymeric immunoglobulin receptor [Channa argus]